MVRTKTTPLRKDRLTPRDAPPADSSARRMTRSSDANLTPGLDREPRRQRNIAAEDGSGGPSDPKSDDPKGKGKKVADQDPDNPKGKKKATGKAKKSADVDSGGKKSDDSREKVTKRGKGAAAAEKCKRSDLDDGGDDVDGDGSSGKASKKGKREAAGKSKKSDGGGGDVAAGASKGTAGKKGKGKAGKSEKSAKDDGDDVDDSKGKGKKAAVALRPVTRTSSILKVDQKSDDGDDQKADDESKDDDDDDDDDDGGKAIVAQLPPRRFDIVILQTWMDDILFRRKSDELKDLLESSFPNMTVKRNIDEVKQGQFDILDGDHEPLFQIPVEDPPYPELQQFDINVVVNIIKDAQK